jgi:hypothetical protein
MIEVLLYFTNLARFHCCESGEIAEPHCFSSDKFWYFENR